MKHNFDSYYYSSAISDVFRNFHAYKFSKRGSVQMYLPVQNMYYNTTHFNVGFLFNRCHFVVRYTLSRIFRL